MKYALDPCPDDNAFRFKNGARARSLQEFAQTIGHLPPEVLLYHREHFQHWVRDILQDPPLAERLKQEGQRATDGDALRRSVQKAVEPALRSATAPRHGDAAGTTPPAPSGRRS